MILSHVQEEKESRFSALKNLRLSCPRLSRIAAAYLFRDVSFMLYDRPERINGIIWNSTIQAHVRALKITDKCSPHSFASEAGSVHNPFVNVTALQWIFASENSERLADVIGKFVYRAGGLQWLYLARSDDCRTDWVRRDQLRGLANTGTKDHWRNLHTLELRNCMTGASLEAFLSHVAPSLRDLTLHRCELVGANDSWPLVVDNFRSLLRLKKASLGDLSDPHWYCYLSLWSSECQPMTDKRRGVLDYLLRKTDTRPEWDDPWKEQIEDFVKLGRRPPSGSHIKECDYHIRVYRDLFRAHRRRKGKRLD